MSNVPAKFTHWTEEEEALLRHLWVKGFSASQIGKRLDGKTRNAVIGKVHRLGLQRRRPSGNRAAGEILRRLQGRKQLRQGGIRKRALKPPKLGLVQLDAAPQESLALALTDLTHGQCRWPTNMDRPHVFCGHPWHGDTGPYCTCHMRMAHRQEPKSEPKPVDLISAVAA